MMTEQVPQALRDVCRFCGRDIEDYDDEWAAVRPARTSNPFFCEASASGHRPGSDG